MSLFPITDPEAMIAEYEAATGRTITGATRRLLLEYINAGNEGYAQGFEAGKQQPALDVR